MRKATKSEVFFVSLLIIVLAIFTIHWSLEEMKIGNFSIQQITILLILIAAYSKKNLKEKERTLNDLVDSISRSISYSIIIVILVLILR